MLKELLIFGLLALAGLLLAGAATDDGDPVKGVASILLLAGSVYYIVKATINKKK